MSERPKIIEGKKAARLRAAASVHRSMNTEYAENLQYDLTTSDGRLRCLDVVLRKLDTLSVAEMETAKMIDQAKTQLEVACGLVQQHTREKERIQRMLQELFPEDWEGNNEA